jgi:hypothetical protein
MKRYLLALVIIVTCFVPTVIQGADTDMSGVSLNDHWFQTQESCQEWLDQHPVPNFQYSNGEGVINITNFQADSRRRRRIY